MELQYRGQLDGCCSGGPLPVSAIHIASNSSRRASGTSVVRGSLSISNYFQTATLRALLVGLDFPTVLIIGTRLAPDEQKVTCHGRPKSRESGSLGVGTRPKRPHSAAGTPDAHGACAGTSRSADRSTIVILLSNSIYTEREKTHG
jgi:hypothetical protein